MTDKIIEVSAEAQKALKTLAAQSGAKMKDLASTIILAECKRRGIREK